MSYLSITLKEASKSGLTNVYTVSALTGIPLGEIKWYAPWRKYTFVPNPGTVFDSNCLIDIAAYLQAATKNRES